MEANAAARDNRAAENGAQLQQGGEEARAEGGMEGDPLSLNDPWLKDFLGAVDVDGHREPFPSDLEAPCKRR